MFEAVLYSLERHRAIQDRLAVLDRLDTAHGKAVPVARAIDVIDDRRFDVTRAQEIRVQRMRGARGIDSLLRCRQGLAQHLTAENVSGADVAALAAEQVVFQAVQFQQLDQFGDARLGHGGRGVCKKTRNYNGAAVCSSLCKPHVSITRCHGNCGPGSSLRCTCFE